MMGLLSDNLDLLIVGYAGTYGTEQILSHKVDEIRKRFGKAYLTEEIVEMMGLPRIQFKRNGLSAQHLLLRTDTWEPAAEDEEDVQAKKNAGELVLGDSDDLIPGIYEKFGIRKIKEIGKGGVLAALWDFLEEDSISEDGKRSGKSLGCEFRYDHIPLCSISLEICELFSLNPYRLHSENCWLLAAERGAQLQDALRQKGIHSEIFGHTTENKQRVRVDGKERSFLQKSHKDELEKLEL